MASGSKIRLSENQNQLMRDYFSIIRRNLFSPIVIAIFVLAGALIYVHEYRDAWFISVVIIINTLIGIVQEIRAKHVLRKLELMSQPLAHVVRNNQIIEIPYNKLQVGDEIILQSGDEIPADGKVISSHGLEVNESMLTGESAAIDKAKGDKVFAATTVLAGNAHVEVLAVGNDTKAGAISSILKRYKPELTPLQKAIQHAITSLTYSAIVLAGIIALRYYFEDIDAVIILKSIITGALTIVPEGLLLASSLLLAFGSLKLAQAKVLPQKLSAIEAMALLNTLCVDKTGTLTSDEITLEKIIPFSNQSNIESLVALVAHETSGGNATGTAITAKLQLPTNYQAQEVLAFSSARKLSGLRVKIDDQTHTLMMGAPEFVAKFTPLTTSQKRQINQLTDNGLRVLLLAEFDNHKTKLKHLPEQSGKPLAVIALNNSLRDGVIDTVEFLQKQGVDIRVISGDNPRTVQYIAEAAGIKNPTISITGDELANLSDSDFAQIADRTTIFARVQPEQKERLIDHFEKRHKFTGMVGDGVNDALALKKADLGVAMHAGAPASRRVSDIILLNNSFNSLPLGMKLGNKIMLAIETIAILFFHKIIYGVVLLFLVLILGMPHPFAPRHITFMNIFLVTMPTIMWTLFPPESRYRINPKKFWRDTLFSIIPIATITGIAVTLTYWLLAQFYPQNQAKISTMTVIVATIFGIHLVFLVSKLLKIKVTKLAHQARLLYAISIAVVALLIFITTPLRQFFDFTMPDISMMLIAGITTILGIVAQRLIAKVTNRHD